MFPSSEFDNFSEICIDFLNWSFYWDNYRSLIALVKNNVEILFSFYPVFPVVTFCKTSVSQPEYIFTSTQSITLRFSQFCTHLGVHLGPCSFITYIHYDRKDAKQFNNHKNPFPWYLKDTYFPLGLETTHLFSISIILSSQKCYVIGIINMLLQD